MSKEDILSLFRKIGIIYKEPVTLRSGVISDFYCDIKKAYGCPELLNALADEIGKKLPAFGTCVAASGYGGLPIAAVVAARFGKKFVAVRDIAKKYGKGGLMDGYIPTEKDIITIIDDVLTTGSSIKTTLAGLAQTKGKIDGAIIVVKRGEAKLPIPCNHLFTIEELLDKMRL